MYDVRAAAVAGMFYPDAPPALAGEVRAHLARAAARPAGQGALPKAIIAPHAGYIYSGAIAGAAYARLVAGRETIRRVVLFGPAHRAYVRGLALPRAQAFATPLGRIEIDQEAARAALTLPQVLLDDAAHAREHALEVQLPFLQTVLAGFRIVPFAVGDATAQEVAEVMELLWGGSETLIVVSSDLSHYQRYAEACAIDRDTADRVLALSTSLDHEQACGATPINGLASVARRHGLRPELLDLRNSGDTAGDKSRVVGYAAFAFTPPAEPPTPVMGRTGSEATS
jgi:MEMO1 family protein